MTSAIQLLICYLAVYRPPSVHGTPFGEFNFKKNIDFGFKPIPFKPLAFIKEFRLFPWGVGLKHGVEKRDLVKRDLDNIKTVESLESGELRTLTRLPAAVYEESGEVPFLSRGPFPVVPLPVRAPPPPPIVITSPPPRGLNTQIKRDDLVESYLKAVEKLPEEKFLPPIPNTIVPELPKKEVPPPAPVPLPPPPPPPEKEELNPLIRGSRLALYFGNLLLQTFYQLLAGQRAFQFPE